MPLEGVSPCRVFVASFAAQQSLALKTSLVTATLPMTKLTKPLHEKVPDYFMFVQERSHASYDAEQTKCCPSRRFFTAAVGLKPLFNVPETAPRFEAFEVSISLPQ